MRGCLSVLVLAAIFVVGSAWFAGPAVAGFVIETALANSGFHGANTSVRVVTNPPLEVLAGRVDRVDVDAQDASLGGLDADDVELSLFDVDLVDRHAGSVDGRLLGVRMRAADGSSISASSVDVVGRADRARATIRIPGSVVNGLALAAIQDQVGFAVGQVVLVPPDRVAFTLAGARLEGRLVVEAVSSVRARDVAMADEG